LSKEDRYGDFFFWENYFHRSFEVVELHKKIGSARQDFDRADSEVIIKR
jgi:hypothetical protein